MVSFLLKVWPHWQSINKLSVIGTCTRWSFRKSVVPVPTSAFTAGSVGQTSLKDFWHWPRVRVARRCQGNGTAGRPGEQQACLIRQGLVSSAQLVLSLLHNTDIIQTPTNSKNGKDCCPPQKAKYFLWNGLLRALCARFNCMSHLHRDRKRAQHAQTIFGENRKYEYYCFWTFSLTPLP